MRRLWIVAFAMVLVCPGTGKAQTRAGPTAPSQADTLLDQYTGIFVTLAGQALNEPRLAAPMPCLPHWLAGNDHVVVAVSSAGAAAGLERSDTLTRIGTTALTGSADGVWDAAMRGLSRGLTRFVIDVSRAGKTVRLTLPCASDLAVRLHQAERAMWTAITRRDWRGCIDRGDDMIRAFGAAFSPPLMVMTRCVSAETGGAEPALSNRLALALLDELVAHPKPSPDLREQLNLTLRDLEMIPHAGGEDFAAGLRARMTELGVDAPSLTTDESTGLARPSNESSK